VIEDFLNTSQLAEVQLDNIILDIKKFSCIFQNENDENDRKRLLRTVDPDNKWITDDKIKLFGCQQHILNYCEEYFPKLSLSPMSVLVSLSGCAEQQSHTDYDLKKSLVGALKSRILIVAIMDNTKIITYDDEGYHRKEIVIPKGGIFIGRGSLLHNGAAYENTNLRLHFYLDHRESSRITNTVYNMFWYHRSNTFQSLRSRLDYSTKSRINIGKVKVQRVQDSRRKKEKMTELCKLRWHL
jgi:hypothetical protein